jgi:hypothetical protein
MSQSLLGGFLALCEGWKSAFAQSRTHERAVRQAVAGLCCGERRTLTRVIQAQGSVQEQRDWSAEYRLHSRCDWEAAELFTPVLEQAHRLCGRKYVPVAFDDTKIRKSGRRIPGASLWVDPLGPKYKVQFLWGLRFLQASVLVPAYKRGGPAARGLPVAFTEVPAIRRPRRRASDEEKAAYREAVKKHNLSTAFVTQLGQLRRQLDEAGARSKTLIATVDGSFCNRTCMRAKVERTVLLARARRDARLCHPSVEPRRTYAQEKFTPDGVRQDEKLAWKHAKVFHGKRYRTIRYKEVGPVLWQGGTGRQPVRLIVLAPTRYRPKTRAKRGKTGRILKRFYYREAGYLLCTDLCIPASVLIQHYFDRWQIEVNHKEEKDTLGIGEAQLRSKRSVPRQPALGVASYSALMLASIMVSGHKRAGEYASLPKWYKGAARPTARDLVNRLRQDVAEAVEAQSTGEASISLLATAIAATKHQQNVQT